MQVKRGFQHLIGPGVDGDAPVAGLAIEPANVAVRIVEAHQPMDLCHRGKRLIDRLCRRRARRRPRISTKVPSSGCARRTLSGVSIRGQDPFDAFGDVHGGQRSAGNVADVAADFQRAGAGLADELREPARASNLAAIRIRDRQDIDATDAAALDRDRVVDVEMLADDMVERRRFRRCSSSTRGPAALPSSCADGNAACCASATDMYWTA